METSFPVKNRQNLVRHLPHLSSDGQAADNLIRPLFAQIGQVSTLPDVAFRAMLIADDPKSTVADMTAVIRSDPPFAARVLRTVNSSAFGIRHTVDSLDQAVVLLGFSEMRNLALTTHVASLFQKTTGHGPYDRSGLWRHMVSSGVVARHIAETCLAVDPDEAYLGGLLHDLGIILLDQSLNGPFCQVIDALDEHSVVAEVEDGILGFDHADLGRYVLAAWRLPSALAESAGFHLRPLDAPAGSRKMACTVALANSLCHRMDIHSMGIATRHDLPSEVFATLELDKSRVRRMIEDLPDRIESASEMAEASLL